MEIDFIEIEHRQNVLKLMDICGLDLKQAYELYSDTGCNFQTAVNMHFNPTTAATEQSHPAPSYQANPAAINSHSQQQAIYGDYEQESLEDIKYQKYIKFIKIGKKFPQKYQIKHNQSFFKSILPTFFKGDEEEPFKKQLQKFIGRRTNIKSAIGYLSQTFEWSWKQKYPIAIIMLDFVAQSRQMIKRIFSDDHYVEKVLCEQFKVYGINAFQNQIQGEFKQLLNPEKDSNSIIIGRVNYIDQVRIVGRIKLTPNMEQNIRKLKILKSKCIQLEMEDSFIIKRYSEQSRGNIDYVSPKTVRQNLKLKEDRQIRRQQEEEFFKACQPKNQSQQKPEQKVEKQKTNKLEPMYKTEKVQQKKLSMEQINKIRQDKRKKLKMYSSGISFKVRLPSGQNMMLQVSGSQKIQYLFDYIETAPQDIGFTNEEERKFNISVGFGGSNTLKGKQKNKISDIFSDSEVLIVREILE